MDLFGPNTTQLKPLSRQQIFAQRASLQPIGKCGELVSGEDTIRYKILDKSVSIQWGLNGKTENETGFSLDYVNASSISEMLEDPNGRLPNGKNKKDIACKIIEKVIDPICRKAFNDTFPKLITPSLRNDRLRFELNEHNPDSSIELLRFHHWKSKPVDERNDRIVESDLIVLEKCYVLIKDKSIVIIDLSQGRAIREALIEVLDYGSASHSEGSTDPTLEHPIKILRALLGRVLRNQDETANSIENRLEELNSRRNYEELSDAELNELRQSFLAHQGELSIAVGKLVEHKTTVAQTVEKFIQILRSNSVEDKVWAKKSERNIRELFDLFESQVVEANSDLLTLNQSINGFNRFMTERQKNATQLAKMEQALRAEQTNLGLQHSNLALAQTNLGLQRAILMLAVPVTTASALQIGISVLPDNLQTIATKIIIATASFFVSASVASFVYWKAAKALNTQKTSIASIEANLTTESDD